MTTITRSRLFIGGTWVEPSSSKQSTGINSTTEEVLGNVPEATEAAGDAAVAAAREAFDRSGWGIRDPAERAKTMRRFADAIDARQEEIARLVTQQVGMPLELESPVRDILSTNPFALLRRSGHNVHAVRGTPPVADGVRHARAP